MWKLLEDFQKFAMRGNVVDLAVGVVIGGAFSKIVDSFVKDVIMPPIAFVTGGVDFSDRVLTLPVPGVESPPEIRYGAFLTQCLDFLIIAAAMFAVVKVMNAIRDEIDELTETEPESPKVPKDVQLLKEIRDALVERSE